jgi:hypothetical protein
LANLLETEGRKRPKFKALKPTHLYQHRGGGGGGGRSEKPGVGLNAFSEKAFSEKANASVTTSRRRRRRKEYSISEEEEKEGGGLNIAFHRVS